MCEGYRFVTYPVPKRTLREAGTGLRSRDMLWPWIYANRSRFGPLVDRVLCCFTRAMELREGTRQGRAVVGHGDVVVLTDFADALAEFAAEFAIHDCELVSKARDLKRSATVFAREAPQLNAVDVAKQLPTQVDALDQFWYELILDCFCSALLPPVPASPRTDCVPLAVVTVGGDDGCRVESVCDWEERKLLISWNTIGYWLSWLPWDRIRQSIISICCSDSARREAFPLLTTLMGVLFAGGKNSGLSMAMAGGGAVPEADVPMAGNESLAMATAPVPAAAEPVGGGAKGKSAAAKGAAAEEAGTQGGAAATAPDPLTAAFAADDFVGHLLGDFRRIASQGTEGTGYPQWMEAVTRVIDGSILQGTPTRSPAVGDLEERLARAEATLKAQEDRLQSQAGALKTQAGRIRTQATRIANLQKTAGKG